MAAHGFFHSKLPHRPLIVAKFKHPLIQGPRQVEFVIDTGADTTFIVPDWQEMLKIPTKILRIDPEPKHTFAGRIKMACLDNCTLMFPRQVKGNSYYEISNLRIFFANPVGIFRFLRRQPLTGTGKFPSVLGRDVLQHMSVGYCERSKYLFLTQRTTEYYNALSVLFPNPDLNGDMWVD